MKKDSIRLLALSIATVCTIAVVSTLPKEVSAEPTENIIEVVETEQNYTYPICDVVELNAETFTAILPNGNLEVFYMIEDFPIDEEGNPYFELVCFKVPTETMDNLNTWEVVGVR